MDGEAWTRAEISQLVEASERGTSLAVMVEQLGRTPIAISGKVRRLRLKKLPNG